MTNDKKSLNDFVAEFEGLGGNTPPKVVPYTFDDIVAGLNAVVPTTGPASFASVSTPTNCTRPRSPASTRSPATSYLHRQVQLLDRDLTRSEEAPGRAWSLGCTVGTPAPSATSSRTASPGKPASLPESISRHQRPRLHHSRY